MYGITRALVTGCRVHRDARGYAEQLPALEALEEAMKGLAKAHSRPRDKPREKPSDKPRDKPADSGLTIEPAPRFLHVYPGALSQTRHPATVARRGVRARAWWQGPLLISGVHWRPVIFLVEGNDTPSRSWGAAEESLASLFLPRH